MENIKFQLGVELDDLINSNANVQELASWAYRKIWHTNLHYPLDVQSTLDSIALMEIGEEFVFPEQKLKSIANQWRQDAEFEELARPVPEIQKSAEDIGRGWLYCPICHEVWESRSTYAMVECPQCKNKLHNPMYVPKTENSF